MTTTWALVGSTTNTSVTATAEVVGASVRLAVSTASGMTSPVYSTAATPDGNGYVRLTKYGLTAGTRYYAALEIDGTIDTAWVNTFTTDAAAPGSPASFTMAFFSCAPGSGKVPSVHPVHDKIATRKCDINFHLGDFGYPNLATNDVTLYRAAWKSQITATHPALLMKAGAFYYVWDDHDFGPDNSDRTAAGAPAAAQVYREMFPYPPLVTSGGIYHAFTKGRVRFIVTDERYYRDVYTSGTDASRTMLGTVQKAWFKAELLAAKTAGLIPVWMSSQTPHQGNAALPDWGAYATERTELWDFFAANSVRPVILAGDRHFSAYQRTVDYSTAQNAPCRVYVSSALDQTGGPAAETWEAVVGGDGLYAVLTVADHTTYATMTVDFYRVESVAGTETKFFSDTFTATGTAPPTPGIYAVRDSGGVRRWLRDSSGQIRYARVT